MKRVSILLKILPVLVLGVFLAACEEEGPAEKMGKEADKAAESMKDTMEGN